MVPIERSLVRTVGWLLGGLVASLPLLLIDTGDNPTTGFLIHLSALVVYGFALTIALLPASGWGWFEGSGWNPFLRLLGSGVAVVVLVTGTVGLVTLASSAALRYHPATQFLQLLSALDIAWVVAAVIIGGYRLWNRAAAIIAGVVMGIVCVWSIWFYVDAVGFGTSGQWIVSGPDMMTRVIPFDVMAATIAFVLFVVGVRKQTSFGRPSGD